MARLAHELTRLGQSATVGAAFTPEAWRARMGAGRLDRVVARLRANLVYPLSAVLGAAATSDVIVPTTNPFHLPAWLVFTRPLHGKRVIPLVYDLYPDALEAAGITRPNAASSKALQLFNRLWFRYADGVVFIGARMSSHACTRYGTPKRRVVIPTGASVAELDRVEREQEGDSLAAWCEAKRVVVTYVGNLGLMHDWATFAEGLLRVRGMFRAKRVGVVIAATGPGVEHLRSAWSDLDKDFVRFEGPLDDRAWAGLLANAQISVVTLRREAAHTSIPSKTFSAMAAGHAIIAVAPSESDLADVVRRHRCGCLVAPGDTDGFVEALEKLVTDDVQRESAMDASRRAVLDHYDMSILARTWMEFLGEVERDTPPPAAFDGLKRTIDVTVSAAGLIVFAPMLLSAMAAVRATMGSPALFRQQRPGQHGRPFELLKLRTMRHAKPKKQGLDADADRLTTLGRFLRASSIDELPTLWNVLLGDMSLVGPRPLLMRYLPRYTAHQNRRHEAKPGITGWAQINGRNAISWEQKFDFDVWYVDHRSWLLDLQILAATVGKVVRREGISKQGHATMPEFHGSEQAEVAAES